MCRIVFIIRSNALRQSFEFYAVICAVIFERTVIDPARLRHIVYALADGPLVLAHYERLVEVVLIKIKADGRSVCSGFDSFISRIFRDYPFRKPFEPYMLGAAVVMHVVVFCPANARNIYIGSPDAESHCVRDRLARAV